MRAATTTVRATRPLLLVLRAQRRNTCLPSLQHANCARSFSSSNDSRNDSNNAAPKFERGLSGLGAVFSRVSDRSSEFQRYQKAGVFPPDDSWLTNMIAFVALNIPQRTQIDAVEFIEGAKHACRAQLTAVNSLEFGKYIGGEISQCDNAHLLQKYCTPAFYQSASSNVKLTYAMRNLIFESQGAAIEGIHLKSVEYARLTDQEYKDEVTGLRQAPFLVWSEDASVERMKLALHVTTVENVKMNYFKRKEETSKFVQQQNAYTWIFESRVTRPEDVDWRIADVYRVSGRVLDLPPEEQAKKAST